MPLKESTKQDISEARYKFAEDNLKHIKNIIDNEMNLTGTEPMNAISKMAMLTANTKIWEQIDDAMSFVLGFKGEDK